LNTLEFISEYIDLFGAEKFNMQCQYVAIKKNSNLSVLIPQQQLLEIVDAKQGKAFSIECDI
jgi:hypothetical protein